MSKGTQPRVSVVMPVYNHEEFLAAACSSVLDQEYDNLQLIAIDDGSSDGSAAVLKRASLGIPTSRFQWISIENGGAHAALNRGIAMADGDVVMFINSDDYYVPGRVRVAVRALSGARDLHSAWGFSACSFIDAAGNGVDPGAHGLPLYGSYMRQVQLGAWAAEMLPRHNIVLTSGNLIVGRDLLAHVGQFSSLRLAHDWDMALRLLAVTDPIIIPDALYLYRLHDTNTFRTFDAKLADSESHHVHESWLEAVRDAPMGSSASLPFVARLRTRRDLLSSWDDA